MNKYNIVTNFSYNNSINLIQVFLKADFLTIDIEKKVILFDNIPFKIKLSNIFAIYGADGQELFINNIDNTINTNIIFDKKYYDYDNSNIVELLQPYYDNKEVQD